MTQMVTRCPKCATAFRITSTQLESAKGAVRCGSCLHIFKAQEHLVKSASPAATPNTTETAPRTTKTAPIVTATAPANTETAAKITAATTLNPAPIHANTQTASAKPKTLAVNAFEPAKAPVASKPLIDKTKVLADEDDVLISDDMDAATEKASPYDFDGFFDVETQPKQTMSLFEREIRFDEPKDDDEEDADESWAEGLLNDDDESPVQIQKPASAAAQLLAKQANDAPPATVAPQHASEEQQPPAPQTAREHPNTPEHSSSYAGPVFSLVSESPTESPTAGEEQVFSEAFLSATRAPDAALADSSTFAAALFEQAPAEPNDTDEEPEKAAGKRPVKSPKMRAFDSSRAALLMNIMPAPLEFTAKRMRRWYQKKLWASLAILMSAALLAQIAYFKFDYFSRVEPYRTLYLFTCPVLGCEVPSLIDAAQIEATNLIVRNHPSAANALLVDAILINKADFEQPFPDLILSFSTLDEVLVASRRFTPKEYLGGELAGMKYIPMHQPVHITLEISDPGPDAPNYSLITH